MELRIREVRNVYDTWPTEIVPGSELVGRQGVLREIHERLTIGRSVILAAPRREGKSSIAREAVRRLVEEEGYLAASLDFFRVTTRQQCAEQLVRQLLAGSRSFGSRLRRAVTALHGWSPGEAEPHLKLAEVEFGISLRGRKADPEQAFRQALELPQTLAQAEGRRAVILMDEFQDAGKNLGPGVYAVMRSYFQEQPLVKHMFAGSQQSLLRALFARGSAPLLRYADEVRIPPVALEAWAEYVCRKYEYLGVRCSRVLALELVRSTGGHPADTMQVCVELTNLLRAEADPEVTPELVAIALAQARETLRRVMEDIWVDIGSTAYARLAAQRIAAGEPVSTGLKATQAARAVAALLDKGIVERRGRRLFFREPFFEEYVRSTRVIAT